MLPQDFPPPIIVLAAPAMPGSTLAAALGRSPVAYDLPELNLSLAATVDTLQRELTGLRSLQMHGLLRALAQLLAGEQTAAAVEMARRWLSRRAHESTEAAARELAALVAPRRLVAPATTPILDRPSLRRLLAAWPEAVFVHLQVHPRLYGRLLLAGEGGEALLQLTGALDEATDPPTPDPQLLWLEVEEALAEFAAGLPEGRVLSQRLEDLAADPGSALAALARRLGLPTDGVALAAMMEPERTPFAGPGPIGAHLRGNVESFASLQARLPDPGAATLAGPLSWRPDGEGFRPEVRRIAEAQGYA